MAISTKLAQSLILKIGQVLEKMGLTVVYRRIPNKYEVVMFHSKEKTFDEVISKGEVYRIAITGNEEEEVEDGGWVLEWGEEGEEEEEDIETYFWSLRHSVDQQDWVFPLEWAALKTGKKLPLQITKKLNIQEVK